MSKLLEFLRVFLKAENKKEVKRKGFKTFIGAAVYWVFEYGTVVFTAALVGLMEYRGMSEFNIFLLLWAGCVILAVVIIWANQKTGVDFTFFAGYARLAQYFPASGVEKSLIDVQT